MQQAVQQRVFELGGLQIRQLPSLLKFVQRFEISSSKEGEGPGLHFHRDMEESFYIIAGQVSFQIGEMRVIAKSGDHLVAPKSTVHAWSSYGPEPMKMQVAFSPSYKQAEYFSDLERYYREGKSWEEAIATLSLTFDNIPAARN